jgi:hypothetical protein
MEQLLSAPLHASVTLHSLLNVPVHFANKMGLKRYLMHTLSALRYIVVVSSHLQRGLERCVFFSFRAFLFTPLRAVWPVQLSLSNYATIKRLRGKQLLRCFGDISQAFVTLMVYSACTPEMLATVSITTRLKSSRSESTRAMYNLFGAPPIATEFFESFLLLLHTHYMLRPLRAIFRWNIYTG